MAKLDFVSQIMIFILIALVAIVGIIVFDAVQTEDKSYHILIMSQTYDCNGFEIKDRTLHLSDCLYDRSYTVYNPVNVVVREGK